jgi:pimeloyl-ACP methyl ester carboxylesterase
VESLLLIDSSYKVPSELNFERLKIPLPAHDSYAYRFLSALIKNQKRFNYLISNDVKGFKKKIKDSTVRFFLKRLFEAPLPTTLYFIEQMYNLDIKTRLSEINVPTLILIGKQDEFFDQSTQKEMSSMIKGSRLIIDEGSHFNVCFEAIKISKQIEEFLKEMK